MACHTVAVVRVALSGRVIHPCAHGWPRWLAGSVVWGVTVYMYDGKAKGLFDMLSVRSVFRVKALPMQPRH